MTRDLRTFLCPTGLLVLGVVTVMGCSQPPAKPEPKAAKPPVTDGVAEPKLKKEGEDTTSEKSKNNDDGTASIPGAVAELVSTLTTTGDSRTRVITIDAIAEKRRGGLPAIGALMAALDDPEPRVRWHAARAIGLIGHEAVSAIPSLIKLLADKDPVAVTQAASAIGHIRSDDDRKEIPTADAALYASTIEPLVEVMLHPDPRARRAAVRAIGAVSTSQEQILGTVQRHLQDADPMAVMPALHTLADMGEDAVPFLINALDKPESRFWAEVVLSEIGPAAAAAAEPLAKLAGQGEIEDRVQSILALARIGAPAKVAGPQLVDALESPDESLRYVAAYALGKLEIAEGDAALEKATKSEDPFLVTLASWARAKIHPENVELRDVAAERLLAALMAESPQVRRAAVEGLSELEDDLSDDQRQTLATTFVTLLADPVPEVSLSAGGALIRLGPDAIDALRGALSKPGLRQAGMEILAELGPAALPAIGDMIAGLAESDPVYRADSALAIAAIGPEAKEAVGPLEKLLADENAPAEARYTAAYSLGRIGPDAAVTEPLLRKLADSDDELMATVAVWAALKIKPDDTSLFDIAIPKLRHTLNQERELARLEAAVALGEIGPQASSALPLLEMLAEEDPSPTVRAAAAAAVKRIRKAE